MAGFSVSAESLFGASALLSAPEIGVLGCGGAAAGTPVAGAWSELVSAADRVSRASCAGVEGLSRGVWLAGRAYQVSDQSSAQGFAG